MMENWFHIFLLRLKSNWKLKLFALLLALLLWFYLRPHFNEGMDDSARVIRRRQ